MKQDILKEIAFGQDVAVSLDGHLLKVTGPQGTVERNFVYPKVEIKVIADKITLFSKKGTKKEKTIVGSFYSHIKNMVQGVLEQHTYKLKICSGHFPMNVLVSGKELVIKNFLGETVPRKVSLIDGVEVKINGTEIMVRSADKELAGQMAARIEQAGRITNRDIRIFQDGCYIIEKAGKAR
ncbi:MAG TPA: 50S ribosomal protein L6 [Candidatus Nanoarchaeia archaeon]|nr:50S ribosomal protein L6 [Candidatus Nanoarchaeia archaeon]